MKLSLFAMILCCIAPLACAQDQPAATKPVGKFPHLVVDAKNKQLRVDCEALNVNIPLEFFCCVTGSNEHESILRSLMRPSDLHTGMLMLGLKPGEPVHYSEGAKKWLPPHGPPVQISVEYQKEGKTVSLPAYRLMRDVKSKKEMPPMTWIFAGSRVGEDGQYAADVTGYLVSIVNFDLTVIDIPKLASSNNETLEWERNPDLIPPTGTAVTMIIEPAGKVVDAAPQAKDGTIDTTLITVDAQVKIELDHRPVGLLNLKERLGEIAQAHPVSARLSADPAASPDLIKQIRDIARDAGIQIAPATPPVISSSDPQLESIRQQWTQSVAAQKQTLEEAARAHYKIINDLRTRQQKLIEKSDEIQHTIDDLEKQYQSMTTPKPEHE